MEVYYSLSSVRIPGSRAVDLESQNILEFYYSQQWWLLVAAGGGMDGLGGVRDLAWCVD